MVVRRGRWGQSLGLLACGLCFSLTARAQTTTPPASSAPVRGADTGTISTRVIPPEPIDTPIAPMEVETREEIVLELTIDATGKVVSAAAVSGADPYATEATKAALGWTFTAARKGDRAVAARIHFLVTFEPKPAEEEPSAAEPTPSEATTPGTPPPPAAPSVKTQSMAEVIVVGELKHPGAVSLTRAETRNLAGAFDDPLRSVEVLPGVSPIASGLPLFFVRGAPPGNVGYFIDGVRIPLLYHAFLGPSVIHPAFLEQVTLHAGPAPVRFGRFAGATVEAGLAKPRNEFRGEASVRLLDAGAFVESPFANGNGYALLGGRYSYTALLVSLFSPGQRVDYWDYQGLVGYRLGNHDEISLFTFGAFDYFSSGETRAGTEFHRVDMRWDHSFSERTKSRWAVTLGRDQTQSDAGFVSDNSLQSRLSLEHQTDDVVVRSGADVSIDNYGMEVDPAVPEPEIYLDLFPPRTDAMGGAYLDFVLFPSGPVQVIPGVRADLYSSLGELAFAVDPRISVAYQLTRDLRSTHSLAVAHQSPNFVPGVPGAVLGGIDGGLQQSLQAASSFEATLPWEMTGSVAFFINTTDNLSDPIGLGQSLSIDESSGRHRSLGRAAGVEFYLKRPLTRHLGGLISYTYAASSRSFGPITTVPGYDRPHVLNLALTYDLGDNWRASAKFAAASGIPGRRTTLDGFLFDQSRSDPYLRLDLKVSKRWYTSENFYWGAHVEVLNATHTGSVSSRICGVSGCVDNGQTPITFPSLGVEMGWN